MDRREWLSLHLIQGLGNVGFRNLLSRFGTPDSVFQAPLRELMEVEGVRAETAERILKRQYSAQPAWVLKEVERKGARLVCFEDREYPLALKEIHDPPMVLYVKGGKISPKTTFVAVVGSRNPTPYGLKAAESIGQGLARRGQGVVSGMARGIDAAAHWGALTNDGFTVAVLGTGIDVVYPVSNLKLHEKIVEKGAVITEFPPGTPPEPRNFPIRNRVISGLSRAVVVVEATMKSGSLITAAVALEQGREVFAVPGSVASFKSTGCHFLIKQGARLVENADDILEELGLHFARAPRSDAEGTLWPILKGDEKAIYELLGDYPIHIDEIVRGGRFRPGEALSILLKMELKGLVRQLPGKMFVR
ncbi:MAG: DNA-processing protein DprA [Deltaproteobacteria bacterium]|nr:DNA-processing protein DprA [Deltaproteobacteria bacterium]